MKYLTLLVIPAITLLPLSGEAQQKSAGQWGNNVLVTPYLGVLENDTHAGVDVSNTGFYLGMRTSLPIGNHSSFIASFGFNQVDGIQGEGLIPANVTMFIGTMGMEFGLSWKGLRFAAGASLGGSLIKADLRPSDPGAIPGDYTPFVMFVPSLSVSRRIGSAVGIQLMLEDIYNAENQSHNPAFSLGMSFVP